ncbi:MAG: polysaccharide biosynthesis C-terminal domain-containing protein [Candidatus Hydrogenedentes bacterium]|nr:polysaccharide biosynthesis C-terminal domain-containing protein [Candidatus Hydrogenedentota bacterium]
MAAGILAAVIFTNALDRAGDNNAPGVFALLLLLSELLMLFNNFGLVFTLPKLIVSSAPDRRNSVAWSALLYQIMTSVAFAVPVYLLWIVVDDPTVISTNESWVSLFPYLWALPLLVLLGNLRENALAALAGFDRYGARAAGLIATAIVNLVMIVVLLWYLYTGLTGLLLATMLTYLFGALWFCYALPRFRKRDADWHEYRKAVRFTVPLFLNNLLGFASTRCDTLIIAWLLGPAAAAYFEFIPKRFSAYLNRITVSALTPFLPRMSALVAQDDHAEASQLLNAVSFTFTAAGYTGVLLLVAVQDWLVGLLFPPEYKSALSSMGLVLASGILCLQAGIAGLTLIALEKPKAITIVNAITAILSLTLNIIFVPWLGMVGAGIAAVLSGAFSDTAQVWYVSRYGLRVSWTRFLGLHFLFLAGLVLSSVLANSIFALTCPLLFVLACLSSRILRLDEMRSLASQKA